MRRTLLALGLVLLAAGCAPEAGPVDMAVLVPDPVTGNHRLEVVRVETLEDISSLRGAAATPIGGAVLLLDPWRLGDVDSVAEFRARVVRDPGGPVEAQFVERDGVLWPVDFHSLALATAYRNFEVARRYALARGMPPDGPLDRIPFYYAPVFRWRLSPDEAPTPITDNAAFFGSLGAFLFLPFDEFQDIPLAMNCGVIAHEYAHAVFAATVFGSDFSQALVQRWTPGASGLRLLGAVEEGFADAWGAGVCGDPRYASRSFPESLGDDRRLDGFVPAKHCYAPAAFAADLEYGRTCDDGGDRFWGERQYRVGTVLAAALWRAGQEPGTDFDRVMDAVFASYRGAGEAGLARAIEADDTGAAFGDLAVPARALVAGAPDEPTRRALCRVLAERLAVVIGGCEGIPPAEDGCGAATLAPGSCS